jgi:hypothetical protein
VGVVSATGFVGDLSGTSITVGDKFINSSGVGLGATDTTGRNAGVGTAVGTIVFNSSTNAVEVYNGTEWGLVYSTSVIKATGGSIAVLPTNKVVHTFTGSGTFQVTNPALSSVDYLVVAGGGGGGSFGGGGAGGFRTGTGLPVSATPGSYTITVGGAGESSLTYGVFGTSGSPSIFSTITSTGGGGGGANPGGATTGGSGGGGGYGPSPGGTGTGGAGNTPPTSPPQGNNGGSGTNNGTSFSGGGGGGATATGSNATAAVAGNGGNGTASSISGASVTYAGGGGGATWRAPDTKGTGGSGGGGNGGTWNSSTISPQQGGSDGSTNMGAGGGGRYSGGSGIVIIAYPS